MLLGLITLFRYERGNLDLKQFNLDGSIVHSGQGNASKY